MYLVCWSDAAFGDNSAEGTCLLGYVFGLMAQTLNGPCHILQWTLKLTRKQDTNSRGGEVYTFSNMVDHMSPSRASYEPRSDVAPGMIGFEDCESLFAHLGKKKSIAAKYLVRHFLRTQLSSGSEELDNVFRAPDLEDPPDELTKVKSEMVRPSSSLSDPGGTRVLVRVVFFAMILDPFTRKAAIETIHGEMGPEEK